MIQAHNLAVVFYEVDGIIETPSQFFDLPGFVANAKTDLF
jgi:hypothetical protein